ADEGVAELRARAERIETDIKAARHNLDSLRTAAADFDVSRAAKESELAQLTTSFVDTMQTSIDEVFAEVAELERAGGLVPDARVICAEEADEASEDGAVAAAADGRARDALVGTISEADSARFDMAASTGVTDQRTLSAEEAIGHLRT